jgi:hypothetical protein
LLDRARGLTIAALQRFGAQETGVLSTAYTLLALFSAIFAALAAWVAGRHAAAVVDAETALKKATRALTSTTDRLSSVEGRLDRIAGRVYSQTRKPRPVADDDDEQHVDVALDPELAAELALQSAPAVMPGRGAR